MLYLILLVTFSNSKNTLENAVELKGDTKYFKIGGNCIVSRSCLVIQLSSTILSHNKLHLVYELKQFFVFFQELDVEGKSK